MSDLKEPTMTDDQAVATERLALRQTTQAYEGAVLKRSLMQLANSVVPFFVLSAAMYWMLPHSYLLTLLLGILAGGFVVRIFIIQHDCGHGSFFKSRRANDAVGMFCSLITLTPYAMWRRHHSLHHGNWNNLDHRESGVDIYSGCLTVAEYQALTGWQRWRYRMTQHPLIAWVVLPPVVFLLLYRVPFDTPANWQHERRGVYLTDLVLLGLFLGAGSLLGFEHVLLVQIPVIIVAAVVGVWLFSIQHRFEQSLWARKSNWHATSAALQGSSYLELPSLLQWFTGNIGFHHIHHLNSRIPNYQLQQCHRSSAALRTAYVMKPWHCLRAWRAALWDEQTLSMVPFKNVAIDK